MFIVIGYDTPDNKRRSRFVKVLKDYGYRVQKSVFEVEAPEKLIRELCDRLRKEVDQAEDSIRIYRVCEKCLQQTSLIGQSALTNQETVFIV